MKQLSTVVVNEKRLTGTVLDKKIKCLNVHHIKTGYTANISESVSVSLHLL